MNQAQKIHQFVVNLNEEAVRHIVRQLLGFPESKKFLLKCVEEFHNHYTFPIEDIIDDPE